MKNYKVSAVIITHNRIELLKKAVSSVKNQTYKNIEIIVVDDASTDGTAGYGKELLKKGIKYIRISEEESLGGNYARNIGIGNSTGDLIAFLDDDDTWLPEKTYEQVRYFDENPDTGMVYSGLILDYGKPLLRFVRLYSKDFQGDIVSRKLYYAPFCTTITMMVRREVLEKTGGFDINVRAWQEYELSLRIIQVTKTGYINRPLSSAGRDIREERITNEFDKWRSSVKYIYRKHKKLFEQLDDRRRVLMKEYYYKEAAYRASVTAGNHKMKKYYFQAFKLHHKPEYLIRFVFGLSKNDTLYLEAFIRKIMYLVRMERKK